MTTLKPTINHLVVVDFGGSQLPGIILQTLFSRHQNLLRPGYWVNLHYVDMLTVDLDM